MWGKVGDVHLCRRRRRRRCRRRRRRLHNAHCAICPATDCNRRPWWSFNKIILHGTGTKQLPNSKEVCQKINPKIILLETTSLHLIRASLNIKLVFTCSEHTAAFQDSLFCICTHPSCRDLWDFRSREPRRQESKQPAGVDRVDAVVNSRPAHGPSSVVLKWENHDKAIGEWK